MAGDCTVSVGVGKASGQDGVVFAANGRSEWQETDRQTPNSADSDGRMRGRDSLRSMGKSSNEECIVRTDGKFEAIECDEFEGQGPIDDFVRWQERQEWHSALKSFVTRCGRECWFFRSWTTL